ncbi:NTF2 and RRM domain protein [Aspergillus chevalieri]|uniref:NTF2 and RRM domain protein n=1 Tax=Aspergillus chevalieri TaxID=182096 RepID=A0A7R7VUA0_ASPCH|nr:uncharacterized protein ACHE_60772A [Aspergillus chevalieri]BCR90886.1 hypothetical protein ACHE_60772A [Aspergillus chevalieri]
MADTTQAPINGTYPTQVYADSYNHVMNNSANFQPAQSSTPSNAPPADQKNGISKDEVGWYFVEQYYTNMSRSPDKLHLFYSRRSQFVFGTEAESVPVAVGQKAINEKIKQLDFQDCKVRVLNVDSQASFDNILVHVIGEISNKSEPSRKFVQTFVLAEQPNGYYVLNDIFRYLTEEEEDVTAEEPAPAAQQQQQQPQEQQQGQQQEQPQQAPEAPAEPAAPEAAPAAPDAQVDNEPAVAKVDEKLEEAKPNGEAAEPKAAPETNGVAETQEAPVAASAPALAAEPESTQTEYPPSPEPTPKAVQKEAPAPEKEAPAPTPAAPAAPKTWANIASKPGAAPVVPAIPVAAPKAPAPTSAPQAAVPAAPAPQPAAAPAPTPGQPAANDNNGWQTAGHDHRKTQSRGVDEQVSGYIKNVTDKIDAGLLRQTLSRFGKVKNLEVSRPRNCAFVDFAEPAGYAAAVAANPHQIGSEQINVEERRARNYGNANYGPRGGAGRGRGDRAGSQGRGGFQRDGRGGFVPRGRGNFGPKGQGRNQAQTA